MSNKITYSNLSSVDTLFRCSTLYFPCQRKSLMPAGGLLNALKKPGLPKDVKDPLKMFILFYHVCTYIPPFVGFSNFISPPQLDCSILTQPIESLQGTGLFHKSCSYVCPNKICQTLIWTLPLTPFGQHKALAFSFTSQTVFKMIFIMVFSS